MAKNDRADLNARLQGLRQRKVTEERALESAQAALRAVDDRRSAVPPGGIAQWNADRLAALTAVQQAGATLQATANEISQIMQDLMRLG